MNEPKAYGRASRQFTEMNLCCCPDCCAKDPRRNAIRARRNRASARADYLGGESSAERRARYKARTKQ